MTEKLVADGPGPPPLPRRYFLGLCMQYDQEIPQSCNADQPIVALERTTDHCIVEACLEGGGGNNIPWSKQASIPHELANIPIFFSEYPISLTVTKLLDTVVGPIPLWYISMR